MTAAPEAKRRGRLPGVAKPSPVTPAPEKQTRGMSEDGRARIAAAQKARWAAKKKSIKQTSKVAAPTVVASKADKPAKQATLNKAAAVKQAAAPAKAAPAKTAKPVKKQLP